MTNGEFIVVTTTLDDEDAAHELARAVVDERLAACAQVYPVRSVYRWEGEVRSDAEFRVDFKTRADLTAQLTAFIAENHSYLTPEIIAVPVAHGSPAYLEWVRSETTRA